MSDETGSNITKTTLKTEITLRTDTNNNNVTGTTGTTNKPIAQWAWLGTKLVWIMIFIFGPLALPLLFLSPHFSKKGKIIISIALALLTVMMSFLMPLLMETALSLGVL